MGTNRSYISKRKDSKREQSRKKCIPGILIGCVIGDPVVLKDLGDSG